MLLSVWCELHLPLTYNNNNNNNNFLFFILIIQYLGDLGLNPDITKYKVTYKILDKILLVFTIIK